jgi:methylmalonyl-CoA/ethylmalonyl-CoA epimerase
MAKIDHIGIAVKDLEQSEQLFAKLLNINGYKREFVASENVTTSFFQQGETKIELIGSEDENSAISKFIERKGEGIHHIAIEVENIEAEMQRLVNEGFTLVNDTPKIGADQKMICFLHPKSTNGVLIELVQTIINPL